jgi:ribosomal protein S18 acetylase RimI-like enzyme
VSERIARLLITGKERLADEVRPCALGTVLRTPSLPAVWDLSALRVESVDATAAQVADEAERVLGGFEHRQAVVFDESLAAALRPGLGERGFACVRTVMMVHRGTLPEPPGGAAELSRPEAAPLLADFRRTRPYASRDGVIEQLAAMDERATRELAARDFCAPAGGPPLAGCRLFTIEGAGQVEHVGTLPAARGRGLGRAALLTAMAAAGAAGLDPLFLMAYADDWPRRWYERLGFEPVGLFYDFTRSLEGRRTRR